MSTSAVAPKGAAETDADYLSRLQSSDNQITSVQANLTWNDLGNAVFGPVSASTSITEQFPIIVISLAYLVMFAMVFDYSRWISNWAVCLFLILHAVKTLPASRDVVPILVDDRKTLIFGWIITLIPRVGIVRPF